MKIENGQQYWRKDGKLSGTIVPNDSPCFPFKDSATGVTYTEHGTFDRAGRVAWPDDLVLQDVPEGDDLPEVNTVTMSATDYERMKEMENEIQMQKDLIKVLRATIARKNKIMAELMDLARKELAKQN